MGKGRLEAFSDGVLAIIITIMVLELKTPKDGELRSLLEIVPVLLSYLLSFIYVGIYWNNHHHLLHAVKTVNGKTLWANLHLLFWLSLVPFSTRWLGQNHFNGAPAAVYGFVMLMAALAYLLLQRDLIRAQGAEENVLKRAVGSDFKGKISCASYLIAILVSPWIHWVSLGLYVFVALLWLIPDRRIEKLL